MKKETTMMQEAAPAKNAETMNPVTFKCPNCMMADTCGANCSQWRDADEDGKGRCNVHGGWTDYDKWCCDWYYKH